MCRDPLSENISRKKAVFFEEVGIEDDAPGSLQKVRFPLTEGLTRYTGMHESTARCRSRTSSAARRCGHAEPLDWDMATKMCRRTVSATGAARRPGWSAVHREWPGREMIIPVARKTFYC